MGSWSGPCFILSQLRLQARRERQHQESGEQHELRLQTSRERHRQRRQQESSEQRLDRLRTQNRSVQQFKADLNVPLTYCEVCRCLMFADKAKEINNTVVACQVTNH